MPEIYPENTSATPINESPANAQWAYPDLKATIKLFFIFILMLLITQIPGSIVSMNTPQKFPVIKSITKILLYAIPFLLIINYAFKKNKKQHAHSLTINFNKIQVWLIPVLIIAAATMVIPASQTSAWIPMPRFLQKVFEQIFTKEISFFIMATVAAPILEEILCRGIILKGLLKNYSPFKAILISSVFFSAMHLNPWQSIPAFFYGLFLGWIYYKTKSVIPAMIFHATLNTIMCLSMFLPDDYRDLPGLLGKKYYLIALLALILVFAAMCVIIQKKARIIPGSLFKKTIPTH